MEKNIHQIWLGEKKIPKHIKEWMDEIKNAHPNFNYFFWNDSNIPTMPDDLKQVYNSLEHPAMKSDLLRVYVLYLYGGIYLDADYKLIGNINELECFSSNNEYIVYEKKDKVEDFCNSLLISKKGSKFITYALSTIKIPGMWLGPHWHAQCIYEYFHLPKFCSYKEIINKCNENGFKYIDWEYFDKNIAKHGFLASWYPGSEWKKKIDSGQYE